MEGMNVSVDGDIWEVFGKDMAAIIMDFYKLDSFYSEGLSSKDKATNAREEVEMFHKYLCGTLHIASKFSPNL